MHVYRIAKTIYIKDLSGTGAKRYGGRWNPKGTAVLYTSEHRSLAILEMLVNTSIQALPQDLSLMTLEIAGGQPPPEITAPDLPPNWQDSPAPFRLAEIGSEWVASNKELALKVPSVIVPEEWNILINPSHPDFQKINIKSISSFGLDSRFFNKI